MTIYIWDPIKRKSNLQKHGLDFAEASAVIEDSIATMEDTRYRYRYTERRFTALGYLRGKSVSVTYTEQSDVIRIISFRKASRRERVQLFGAIR